MSSLSEGAASSANLAVDRRRPKFSFPVGVPSISLSMGFVSCAGGLIFDRMSSVLPE